MLTIIRADGRVEDFPAAVSGQRVGQAFVFWNEEGKIVTTCLVAAAFVVGSLRDLPSGTVALVEPLEAASAPPGAVSSSDVTA